VSVVNVSHSTRSDYRGGSAKVVLHFGHFSSLRVGLRERLLTFSISIFVSNSRTSQNRSTPIKRGHLGGKRKFSIGILKLLVELRALVHTGSLDVLEALLDLLLLRLELRHHNLLALFLRSAHRHEPSVVIVRL